MILYGLKPGPLLFVENADFVWAVIASMFIGNIVLIVMNLPLVTVFASLLRIPYSHIYPAILIVCIVGAYAVASGLFEVGLMLVFAICGYVMKKADIPAALMLMALIMGPMLERNLYQARNLAHGNVLVLVQPPILATLLSILVLTSIFVARQARARRADRSGSGGVAEPPWLLEGIPVTHDVERWPEPRLAAAQFARRPILESVTDAALPPVSAEEARRGGARLLELQSACPFRAQAEIRLGARLL